MKVFVTKYALSDGIREVEVKQSEQTPRMVTVVTANPHAWAVNYHGEGKDWHRTREAAVWRAKEMQELQLKALARRIERIKKLKFE